MLGSWEGGNHRPALCSHTCIVEPRQRRGSGRRCICMRAAWSGYAAPCCRQRRFATTGCACFGCAERRAWSLELIRRMRSGRIDIEEERRVLPFYCVHHRCVKLLSRPLIEQSKAGRWILVAACKVDPSKSRMHQPMISSNKMCSERMAFASRMSLCVFQTVHLGLRLCQIHLHRRCWLVMPCQSVGT